MATDLRTFRHEARKWLAENCPDSMRTRMVPGEEITGSSKRPSSNPDAYQWLDRMAQRGWTVPTWPKVYGGAALDNPRFLVLMEEMQRINARPPLLGMGVSMLGPTLLEFGSDEQKALHLPKIARGEVAWCQGYSEPGAGSDLASLQTFAEDRGDHLVVNGAKIWTSGADHADWMFCLVRTDRQVPKQAGITFLLLAMDNPGVSVRNIEMINGASPFCQTFLDDVIVPRSAVVGELNGGWGIAKRLLQHERSGLAALASADTAGPMERIRPSMPLGELARFYQAGAMGDPALRTAIIRNDMLKASFLLTQQRALQERETGTSGDATSIFKYIEAEYVKQQLELQLQIRGARGIGWAGDAFTEEELRMTRLWLEAKSISIAGGSNEIQLNIIAKRVLGLPD